MIRHDVEQGSEAWVRLRLGRPTASRFCDIITPKTLKPSRSADRYMHRLIAERLLGAPLDGFTTLEMERGTELEPMARAAYEFERGVDVDHVGFCTTDDGKIGASTDGLVGDDGILEIKCRMADKHVAALLSDDAYTIADATQIQGGLLVTGRQWCDVIAFNDVLPMRVIRVERDETYINALRNALDCFLAELDEAWNKLTERGVERREIRGNHDGAAFASTEAA